MISKRILVIAFSLFMVTLNTACPRDIADKVSEQNKLSNEYDDKLDQARVIDIALTKKSVLIGFGPVMNKTITAFTWVTYTAPERAAVRSLLVEYLTLMGRVIELQDHKALADRISRVSKQSNRDNQKSAQDYLDTLDKYEK